MMEYARIHTEFDGVRASVFFLLLFLALKVMRWVRGSLRTIYYAARARVYSALIASVAANNLNWI